VMVELVESRDGYATPPPGSQFGGILES